jgi:hypothetical protein
MGKRKKTKGKKRRSGGSLSALRGTIKSAAGTKTPRKKTWKGRALDAVLWVAVIVMAYYVIRSRCSR